MRVLLDEHETILNSYQAQKYGGARDRQGGRVVGKWGETEEGSYVRAASIDM